MALQLLSSFRFVHAVRRTAIIPIFLCSTNSLAQVSSAALSVCEAQVASRDIGGFSTDVIDEASGLALSPDGQHFYVTNDSGDKPRFFRSRLDGSEVEDFRMKEMKGGKLQDWKPFDAEEIAVGPCPKGITGNCVVVADIGDNRGRRKSIALAFFRIDDLPQTASKPTSKPSTRPVPVVLVKKLKLTYPDGPRNAEAFAVLNSRYGLIVSKEQDRTSRTTKPAGVYVVDFEASLISRVAEWDVPSWVKDQGLSALVTALSVGPLDSSKSALRVLLLTYRVAIELVVQTDIFTSPVWPARPWSISSRSVLKIDPLDQQEAIAYDQKSTGFYYTTEAPLAMLGVKQATIRHVEKMECH